jgi:O-succinylhomoserine sulfhydrylase
MSDRPLRPATLLVRGGLNRSNHAETAEVPFLTSGFVYDDAAQAEATFENRITHYQYSRFGNPTLTMLEERLCALEGAEACRLTATGMAAVHAAMLSHLKTGDHVVASRALFGSCHWIVANLLGRYGITHQFVDGADLVQWQAALSRPTAMVTACPISPKRPSAPIPSISTAMTTGFRTASRTRTVTAWSIPTRPTPRSGTATVMASRTASSAG